MMNIGKIKNGVIRCVNAIDQWLAERITYSGVEKREQKYYDLAHDYYNRFSDSELSSRYVNLQRRLCWKKQFTHPLLVLLCSAGIVGSTVFFGCLVLRLLMIYAVEDWAVFEAALGSRSVFLETGCWAFGIFYVCAIVLIGLVIACHWVSFKVLQYRLLVVEEIRADRCRNEVRDDEP